MFGSNLDSKCETILERPNRYVGGAQFVSEHVLSVEDVRSSEAVIREGHI